MPSTETVTLTPERYNALIREKERNQESRNQVKVFSTWCHENKGTTTTDEGLRACTTDDLLVWLRQQQSFVGYYMPLCLGEEMAARVATYEAKDAAEREEAKVPINHVDPWEEF